MDLQRNKVILAGRFGPQLRSELKARNLQPLFAPPNKVIDSLDVSTRAVLVPLLRKPRALARLVAKIAQDVLDSGALLAIVLPDRKSNRRDAAAVASIVRSISESQRFAAFGSVNADDLALEIKAVPAWEPQEVAQQCLEHVPQRAANTKLKIEPAGKIVGLPEILIRRAFSEFASVTIFPLQGGRSQASGVWRVDAQDKSKNYFEPFVVKAGERRDISNEVASVVDQVSNRVPFHTYPPLIPDRCVTGALRRLIVSRFLDRTIRFDDYLELYSPSLAVSAVFDGPLRLWRAPENQLPAVQLALAEVYQECWVIPRLKNAQILDEPFQLARSGIAGVDSPVQVLTRLLEVDPIVCKRSFAHGDLHLRNIFVRHNTLDIILIDFAKVHPSSPMSRDPATLDVALGFDVLDDSKPHVKPLSDDTLLQVFAPPLFPIKMASSGQVRVEAIRRVRMEAMCNCDVREYQMSVACQLIRFARLRPPKGTGLANEINHLRAIAYRCADTLSRAIG